MVSEPHGDTWSQRPGITAAVSASSKKALGSDFCTILALLSVCVLLVSLFGGSLAGKREDRPWGHIDVGLNPGSVTYFPCWCS